MRETPKTIRICLGCVLGEVFTESLLSIVEASDAPRTSTNGKLSYSQSRNKTFKRLQAYGSKLFGRSRLRYDSRRSVPIKYASSFSFISLAIASATQPCVIALNERGVEKGLEKNLVES